MTIEQKLSDLGFSKYFILYNGSWMIYTYDSYGRVDSGFKDTLLKAVNKLGLIVKQRREQMAMVTHVGGKDETIYP
jgi:hypothetical protein